MTAPSVIWVYRFSDSYENPVSDYVPTINLEDHDRYICADAPELVALVRAAKALKDGMHLAILVKNPNGIRLRAEFDAALEAWEKLTHDATT